MCLHLSTAGLRDGDGMVEVGTLLSKLASLVIREVLADSWMSEKTGIAVALTVGADVIDMLLSAFREKLAEPILVELANGFSGRHFVFIVSEISVFFSGRQSTVMVTALFNSSKSMHRPVMLTLSPNL